MPGDSGPERSGSSSMEEEVHVKNDTKAAEPASPATPPQKKPSFLQWAWSKTGLDLITIILMLKGALPPIICIAAYQSDAWAKKYTTLGYLSAIMSFLSLAIQPRAKFTQAAVISILFICFSAVTSLLQIRCVTSARQHTTQVSASASHATALGGSGVKQAVAYNSSASVVAAVFMFAEMYFGNMIRAKRPQLLLPTIQYCIFAIVASSYSPTFPNMTVGLAFIRRLLETFLTGIGIAAGVSYFIVPMTSRAIAGKQMAGLLGLLKAALATHSKYMISLSDDLNQDAIGHTDDGGANKSGVNSSRSKKKSSGNASKLSADAQALKGIRNKIGELFGKLHMELQFARKEIAYGNLEPHHFSQLLELLREIILPIAGMTTFIDIIEAVKEKKRTTEAMVESNETLAAIERLESGEWDDVITMSHGEADKLKSFLSKGLTHISFQLDFVKRPKAAKGDLEKTAEAPPVPGDVGFSAVLEQACADFAAHRETAIQRWCQNKGIELPTTFWDDLDKHYTLKELQAMTASSKRKDSHQQLYLILYVEYLTWSIGQSILHLARWADARVEDGTMTKKRFIFPAWRKLLKLLESAFSEEDSDRGYYDGEGGGSKIWLGDSFHKKKNPEHLPPTTMYQKATDYLRLIPAHFRSSEASFGFRAGVAVMSIGVLNFIHQTQRFYQDQRIMWALIMIAISMSPQTGQGIFGFFARIFGTFLAMVFSLIIWYAADQKTGAVIPLFYLFICGGVLFVVKNPKLAILGILSVVTSILILGYELQERKIGLKLATSNGQPYYPIYELAPYRLATVIGGITVCFIWSYFPYPVTTHGTLRKDLAATLYLLANFYSIVHTTIGVRLHLNVKADEKDKSSPMTKLDKTRQKVFVKCIIMLNRLREHSAFSKFEPTFGGPFPKEQYDNLIQAMQNMFNYTSMMAFSSATFLSEAGKEESQWLADFRRFTADLNITSHDMTSTLCLASASMGNAQPLPPYLKLPRPFGIAERMESVDPEVLSVKHVAEPCYAAFAVLEVASSLVTEEMGRVVRAVQSLVGEVDFSFHVIDSSSEGSSQLEAMVSREDGQPGKGKIA